MTDNEIIKGLGCCGRENCFGCPYCGKCHQGNPMITDALNLITRQQLEIEKLNKEIQITKDAYTMLQTKIEIIKSEAVKEFADRLKNEIINDTAYACDSTQHSGYYDYQIKIGDIPEYIDDIVKEMVGDDNA